MESTVIETEKDLKIFILKKQLFSALCGRFQKEDHIGVHLSFLYLHNYVQFFLQKMVQVFLKKFWQKPSS